MEQPCYKCGQAVEEGIPFCPHCSAPQIRVVIAETAQASPGAATMAPTGDGAAILAMAQPSPQVSSHRVQVLKWCALAGILSFVLVKLNLLIAVFAAGFLSVVFHRWRLQDRPSNGVVGAGIGALGGLMFFAFGAALMALGLAFPDTRETFRAQMMDSAQKLAASRPGEPQVQVLIEQLKTPEGFVTTMIVAGIVLLILCPLIASLGGALAGTLFGRRRKL
jgi:hypothetical protein